MDLVGNIGEKKRKILRLAGVEKFESVLDIGCGDGKIVSSLKIPNYTGVDISRKALSLSKKLRPESKFFHYKDKQNINPADMVICLDVLIHQDSYGGYKDVIKFATNKAKKRLIISGYGSESDLDASCMCKYYEDLILSLKKTNEFKRIYKFSRYRGLDVIIADKTEDVLDVAKNPNDMDNRVIDSIIHSHKYIDQLLSIITASRSMFGWYTKHYPRLYEYPWVLTELGDDLTDKRIVEFGAGISPLPLLIALKGGEVKTIDTGKEVFLQEIPNRNEWGYFNYSTLDEKITSLNRYIEIDTFEKKSIDILYSVSVIEHLDANSRRYLFSLFKNFLKDNGRIFLTVDLYKNSDILWNYNYGKEIESIKKHGTLKSIINELNELGIIIDKKIKLKMPKSEKVDIALLSAVNLSKQSSKDSSILIRFSKFLHTLNKVITRLACIVDKRIIMNSYLFDKNWYLRKNLDVKEAKADPIIHYLTWGWIEGRDPSPTFSTKNYLEKNPDLISRNVCPLVHYIKNIQK